MNTATRSEIVFYNGSGSPFGWRVWLTLAHKGLPFEHRLLSFSAGDTRAPEYRAVNPRGKVPALVHEGHTLWESSAIVEYLEERFPGPAYPTVLPETPAERALARRLVCENDNYIYPHVRKLLAEGLYKPAGSADAEVVRAAAEELQVELDRLAGQVRGGTLLGTLSLADFAVYPSLAFIDRLHARAPHLAPGGTVVDIAAPLRAYMDAMAARPIVEDTWPPHWRG